MRQTVVVGRGLAAAVGTRGVVRGPALDVLLTPTTASIAPPVGLSSDADLATTTAFATLRLLQRLPGWRNTCLFRAVAECLVLRGLGMPATLRLGVARHAGQVAAHAWVECPGHRCRATAGNQATTYAPLRRPGRLVA